MGDFDFDVEHNDVVDSEVEAAPVELVTAPEPEPALDPVVLEEPKVAFPSIPLPDGVVLR